MNIAVIGAGVNGICCAIALAEKGCKVTVFETRTPFSETSSKSSKLLHGGIRYLENFHIKLVREALEDRAWWIKNAAEYTKTARFFIPIYKEKSRSRLKLYFGAKLYEWLAGKNSLGRSKYHSEAETLKLNPELSSAGLLGSVSYVDVQMDDIGLSEWLLKKAESVGVVVKINTHIQSISANGLVNKADGESIKFAKIVNTCGPWAKQLVDNSRVDTAFDLALVKGSHLFVDRVISNPLVIQIPADGRIIFAMPYENKMLIGTTELKHEIADPVICSDQEVNYLLDAVGSVLSKKICASEVIGAYAGLRPIVSSKQNIKELSKANREAAIETIDDLINVFGGKWTSAMRLGKTVSSHILN